MIIRRIDSAGVRVQVLHLFKTVLDDRDELAKLTLHQSSPSYVLVLRRRTNFKDDELLIGRKEVLFSESARAAM